METCCWKLVEPKRLNFASTLVLMLNQWEDCCGTEKGNKEGIVSKVEPGGGVDNIGVL